MSRVAGVSGAYSTAAPDSSDPLLAHLGPAYGLAVGSDGKVYFNDTNANYVLRVSSGPPSAPLNLHAAPDDASVELTWDSPADPGASAMDEYEFSKDNGATWDTFNFLNTNVMFISLTNGTLYTFQVLAHNSYGSGPSATITAIPDVAPTAPGGLTAASGDQTATLSFTGSTSIGGSAISGYQYQLSSGNTTGNWTTLTSTVDSNSHVTGTIGSLTNGQQYSVSVRSTNTGRTSTAAGPVTVTPAGPSAGPPVAGPVPPGAPSTPSAVAGIGSVTVSWSAGSPSTGITGYTVSSSPAGATCSTASPRATRCGHRHPRCRLLLHGDGAQCRG